MIFINTHKTGSYSKEVTLWILIKQLLKAHSQILHFVTIVLGRNSFTIQRSLSQDMAYVVGQRELI
jgi:hypothetical protein